jgi:hypothetical protein
MLQRMLTHLSDSTTFQTLSNSPLIPSSIVFISSNSNKSSTQTTHLLLKRLITRRLTNHIRMRARPLSFLPATRMWYHMV